jgi:hypothetical protein
MHRVCCTLLVVAALSGCSSVPVSLDGPGGASADCAVAASRSLAAETGDVLDVELIVLEAPRLEAWPRSMRGDGPHYVLAQVTPYVAQGGVLADSERADDGSGMCAVFGRRVPTSASRTAGFEIVLEQSAHFNAHSQVDASATRACVGITRGYRPQRTRQHTLGAGFGYYTLDFDDLDAVYDIGGFGAYASAGVEWLLGQHVRFRLDVRAHVWSAGDGEGHGGLAQTGTVAAGVAAWF